MKWVESVYRFFSERLKILYGKKYTTLAGALTYFFWMSLLPFCFLLTALFGASVQRVEWLLKAEIFQGVRDFLYYVFEHARNSSGGINLFLGITAFWSASNFFYQLRHCGEMVYGVTRTPSGWKNRLYAMAATLATMIFVALLSSLAIALEVGMKALLSEFYSKLLSYLLLFLFFWALCILLNKYLTPVRLPLKSMAQGSFLTAALWIGVLFSFIVYLKFANQEKLYGKLAAVIVFLLLSYAMAICLVAGIVYNEQKNVRRLNSL